MTSRGRRSPTAAFFGRKDELARLSRAVAERERIVTVTGPGGVGKTRIAHELAARLEIAPAFAELGTARTAFDVGRAVCAALGVRLASGAAPEDPVEHAGHALARRNPAMLVLDNFEHLVHLAPATLSRWAEETPDTLFLVTSRERLHVDGELVVRLEPFSAATRGAATGDEHARPGEDAVGLFVDRASAAFPDFRLDEHEVGVRALIERVGGLPLAIELCAARVALLSPQQILARLEHGSDLLRKLRAEPEDLHRTLRSAIEWSVQQLDRFELAAFEQCAIFEGDFSLDAAEAVLQLGAGAPPVIDVVQALYDQSLVRSVAPAEPGGERRVALYESTAELAQERLAASPDRPVVERRFADAFLTRAAAALDEPRSSRKPFGSERRSLARALRWSLAAGDDGPPLAALLAGVVALEQTLVPSEYGEGDGALLDLVVARAEARADEPAVAVLVAHAFTALGSRAALAADRAGAEQRFQHAFDVAERARAPGVAAFAAEQMAKLLSRASLDAGDAWYERALTLRRAANDRGGEAKVLLNLATNLESRGELEACLVQVDRVIATLSGRVPGRTGARALLNAAAALLDLGRYGEARAHCLRADEACRAIDDAVGRAFLEHFLAWIDHVEGRLDDADEHDARAQDLADTTGDAWLRAMFGFRVAQRRADRGDHAAAATQLEAVIPVLRAVHDDRHTGLALAWLGALRITASRDAAAGLFVEARGLLEPLPNPAYGEVATILREHLALARVREHAAQGEIDDAIALVQTAEARRAAIESSPAFARSIDVRFAARSFAAALREAPVRTDAVAVAADGSWFRPPRGRVVEFGRKRLSRALFERLVSERRGAAGSPVAMSELLAAGWPGERMLEGAGENRLYVAMNALRNLGIGEILVRGDGGWLLDPAIELVAI